MFLLLFSTAFAVEPGQTNGELDFLSGNHEAETPIINGESSSSEDYPYTGGMLMDATISFFGETQSIRTLACSSTLIAPDVVLLAAHCIDENSLTMGIGELISIDFRWTRQADLTALAGSNPSPEWPSDSVVAWDWVAHQDFSMEGLELGLGNAKDIALLFLDEPILDMEHAYLPTPEQGSNLSVGDEVIVVGWGQQIATNMWENPPEGSYALKQHGLSTIDELGDYEFHVGAATESVRKCHGDSGGPSIKMIDGHPTVVGVTSRAYDQSDCFETGGVDTRVDPFLEWIEQEMVQRCQNGTRSWCETEGIVTPQYYEQLDEVEEESKEQPGACSTSNSLPYSWMAFLSAGLFLLRRQNRK